MGNTAHCQAESGGQPIDGDASPQQSRDNFRGTGKRKKKGPWVCACRSGNCWGKIVWTLNRFHRGAERMELLRIESLGDGLSPSGTIQMEAHMADEMTKSPPAPSLLRRRSRVRTFTMPMAKSLAR